MGANTVDEGEGKIRRIVLLALSGKSTGSEATEIKPKTCNSPRRDYSVVTILSDARWILLESLADRT
jgi:hypothetical protein